MNSEHSLSMYEIEVSVNAISDLPMAFFVRGVRSMPYVR